MQFMPKNTTWMKDTLSVSTAGASEKTGLESLTYPAPESMQLITLRLLMCDYCCNMDTIFFGEIILILFIGLHWKALSDFVTFHKKTKWPTLDLLLKESTWRMLKNPQYFLALEEPLGFFSLRQMPSFNYKSNFNDFVFPAEWQNLIAPLQKKEYLTRFIILAALI